MADDVDKAKEFAISTIIQLKRRTKRTIEHLQTENENLKSETERLKRVNNDQRTLFYKELSALRHYVSSHLY